jgi:hypothetical protein
MSGKVAFIAGHKRGGSTLLTLLLGQQEGYFPAGELNRIWQGGFLHNELCTCGKPFQSCAFWNAVIREAFGGWQGVDAQEMLEVFQGVFPASKAHRLLIPALRSTTYDRKLSRAREVWGALYAAVLNVSGARVVVDASKISLYGAFLAQVPGLTCYPVHLNRHSCGVSYSKKKKRERTEVHWKQAYMTRHSLLHSSYKWVSRNLSAGLLKVSSRDYFHVRYEDLARNPIPVLTQIVEYLDEVPPDVRFFEDDHTIAVRENHMFGGNPMRFEKRSQEINLDDAWKEQMPWSQKAAVILMTWPMLLYYGYGK